MADPRSKAAPDGYTPHLGESRQYMRDIILGVNDGLVSTFLLVAGVVGGGLTATQVLLTGIAGAVAGMVSMGAGEYIATFKNEGYCLLLDRGRRLVTLFFYRTQQFGRKAKF